MEKRLKTAFKRCFALFAALFVFPAGYVLATVPVTFTDSLAGNGLHDFSGGLAGIYRDGHWGYINSKGEPLIKCIYSEAGPFAGNLAPVRVDTKWGYINSRGRMVINPLFDEAMPFGDGLAAVRKGNLWGMIDPRGRMVLDFSFESLGGYYEGLAPAKRLGKWGYIDRNGEFAIKRAWTAAGEFSEGLAPVKDLEGHWGFIDKKGAIYIESQFDGAGEFSEGLAPVKSGSKWGYVNWKGKYVISPQYEDAKPFSGKLAAVKTDGKWGYIDPDGEEKIPDVFDRAGNFSGGRAAVVAGGNAFFIDRWGEKKPDITVRVTDPAITEPQVAGTNHIPGVLAVDIFYVSAANCMGAKGIPYAGDVIYLIRIHGAGLNQDQLFKNGFNGFRYEIATTDETGKYFSRAYPMNAAVYGEDNNGSGAAVNPGEIAFYWKGPKSDGSGRSVKITQFVRDFNNSKDLEFGSLVKTLPAPAPPPNVVLNDYEIVLSKLSGSSVFNGVSAFPLKIKIVDNKGNTAPQAVYDRLVFYSLNEKGAVYQNQVIGADPSDSNFIALIPATWGRTETSGWQVTSADPNYGYSKVHPTTTGSEYRLYHLFASPTTNPERKISIQVLSPGGDEIKLINTFVLNRIRSDVRLRMEGDQNSDAEGRVFRLEADDPDFSHSDPSSGNLDFVFDDQKKYILPVMPEGLNERNLNARFNFSGFQAGFYLTPVHELNKVTCFIANDRTSSLFTTCGKIIYGYLFDVFGRYNQTPLFTDNGKKWIRKYIDKTTCKDEQLTIRWENPASAKVEEDGGSRLMIQFSKQTKRPLLIELSGETEGQDWGKYKEKKYPVTRILVGPFFTPGWGSLSFATGDDQYLYGKTRMTWRVEGFSIVRITKYLSDQLRLQKSKPGSGGRIQMNSEIFINRTPFFHCIEFGVDYTGKELRARGWQIDCRDVKCEGFGIIKGSDWNKWVEGGTFKGQVNKNTFDKDNWNSW